MIEHCCLLIEAKVSVSQLPPTGLFHLPCGILCRGRTCNLMYPRHTLCHWAKRIGGLSIRRILSGHDHFRSQLNHALRLFFERATVLKTMSLRPLHYWCATYDFLAVRPAKIASLTPELLYWACGPHRLFSEHLSVLSSALPKISGFVCHSVCLVELSEESRAGDTHPLYLLLGFIYGTRNSILHPV